MKSAATPLIGIWWDDTKKLVVAAHAPTTKSAGEDWYDSTKSHDSEWKRVAHRFGKSSDDDYFVIPRGRVLLSRDKKLGRILHGNGTDASRLQVIARRFQLDHWEAVLDDHYLVGKEADALFDDD